MNSNHAFAVRKGLTPKKVTSQDFAGSPVDTGFLASGGAALGTNAESSTPPLCGSSNTIKIQETRAQRYQLQNSARDLILWKGEKKGLEYPANYHKTAKCIHVRHGSDVGVHKSIEYNSAFFTGLVVCGNVWTCPVCAAKVQERRRLEIAQAFDWAYGNDKKVVMVTFTFPHYAHQKLKDLLDMQKDAFKRLRAGQPWKRVKDEFGYTGLIRSLEVTLGDNGWHPHTHEAWILDKDASVIALRNRVAKRWLSMCQKVGLVPKGKEAAFLRHAVHVVDNCSTSEYFAKQDDSRHWGADRELAKASSKTSKSAKGYHPFALLAEHAKGEEGKKDAGSRFLEYLEAMRGKAQIFWSRGLKKLVGLEDKTDEELAEEQTDKADMLGLLDSDQWRLIIKHQAKSDALDAAENGGWGAVMALLANLKSRTPAPAQEPISAPAPMPEPPAPASHLLSLDAYLSASVGDRSASLSRCAKPSPAQALIDRFQRPNSA